MDARAFESLVVVPMLATVGGPDRTSIRQKIVQACRTRLFEGGVFGRHNAHVDRGTETEELLSEGVVVATWGIDESVIYRIKFHHVKL